MTREECIKWLKSLKTEIGKAEHGALWHYAEPINTAIEALSAETVHRWMTGKPTENSKYMVTLDAWGRRYIALMHYGEPQMPSREIDGACWYMPDNEWGDVIYDDEDILAWMPLPIPYKSGDDE